MSDSRPNPKAENAGTGLRSIGSPPAPARIPVEKPAEAKPAADPLAEALSAIKSEDPSVRRQAAEALGQSRKPEAAPALMKALEDAVPSVRQAAVDSLGLLTWRPAAPRLNEMLLKDAVPAVRQQAAISLSYIVDPQSGPALVKALGDENMSVRYAALHTLGVLKYAPAEGQIAQLLDSKDTTMRRGAIAALGELQSTGAGKAIAKALDDQDIYVRVEAVKALGSIRYTDSAPALVKLLEKEQPSQVRMEAALSLSKMDMKDGLMTAYEFVKAPELNLRSPAFNVIAAVGDARSLQFLEEMYASEKDPANKGMLDFTIQRLKARLQQQKR